MQRPFLYLKPRSPAGCTDLVEAAGGSGTTTEGACWGGGEGRCLRPGEAEGPGGPRPPASTRGRSLATADGIMWAPGCRRLWSRWVQVTVLLLLLLLGVPPRGLALPPIRYSHAGICPNDMNPNLWVDAQSTCKRECETDQVSGNAEARHGPRECVSEG